MIRPEHKQDDTVANEQMCSCVMYRLKLSNISPFYSYKSIHMFGKGTDSWLPLRYTLLACIAKKHDVNRKLPVNS